LEVPGTTAWEKEGKEGTKKRGALQMPGFSIFGGSRYEEGRENQG